MNSSACIFCTTTIKTKLYKGMVRGGTIPRIQFTVPMIILDEQLTIYKKKYKKFTTIYFVFYDFFASTQTDWAGF